MDFPDVPELPVITYLVSLFVPVQLSVVVISPKRGLLCIIHGLST